MIGRHWLYAAVSLTAAFFSLLFLLSALWIPAKAELAQWLIEHSWQLVLEGNGNARPWPWADTRPVGVLTIPRLGIRQFVLEGNSGRNLAFGPALLDGTAEGSDLVISGHRDTHFRFLQELEPGDHLTLETKNGIQKFNVIAGEIVDSRTTNLVIEPGIKRISLVTCFPFDTLQTGGPLRYVITALPSDDRLASSAPASANPDSDPEQNDPLSLQVRQYLHSPSSG
jgi:sortase A